MDEILQTPPVDKSKSQWIGVETIWGKIGDGKTFFVLKNRILPALAQGRNVYCNVSFGGGVSLPDGTVLLSEQDRVTALLSQFLKKDVRGLLHIVDNEFFFRELVLKDLDGLLLNIKHGSRVIIDEAQMIYPTGNSRAINPLFFKLLCYSRHIDVDFCFLTQNTSLLDRRIISTSNELIMIKNLWFLSTFFKNKFQETHHQNLVAPAHTRVFHSFDPQTFKLYKSCDTVVQRKGRALPFFLVLPVVCFLSVVSIWIFGGDKMYLIGKKKPAAVPVALSTVTPTSAVNDYKDAPKEALGPASMSALNQLMAIDYNLVVSSSTEQNTVIYNSANRKLRGSWVKLKDGSSEWQWHKAANLAPAGRGG